LRVHANNPVHSLDNTKKRFLDMEQHVTSIVVMNNINAYHIRPTNQWNAGQILTDGQRINDTQGRCSAQGRAALRTEERSG